MKKRSWIQFAPLILILAACQTPYQQQVEKKRLSMEQARKEEKCTQTVVRGPDGVYIPIMVCPESAR